MGQSPESQICACFKISKKYLTSFQTYLQHGFTEEKKSISFNYINTAPCTIVLCHVALQQGAPKSNKHEEKFPSLGGEKE